MLTHNSQAPRSSSRSLRLPPDADEAVRAPSPDLAETEEVWLGELGGYIRETQDRQRAVEHFYQANISVRGTLSL